MRTSMPCASPRSLAQAKNRVRSWAVKSLDAIVRRQSLNAISPRRANQLRRVIAKVVEETGLSL